MGQITDVVKNLIILNVVMFLLVYLPFGKYLPDTGMFYPGGPLFGI